MRRMLLLSTILVLPFNEAARGQEPKPLVITGELTAMDPFDKVRKKSRAKVHELKLDAGEMYIIDLRSVDFDTYLRLEDADGRKISENEDGRVGDPNARILFIPKKTNYRAVVMSFAAEGMGRYALQVGRLKKIGEAKTITGKLTKKVSDSDRRYHEHKVDCKAGEFWIIDLITKNFDPILFAGNPRKKLIASDNDGGEGSNSRMVMGIAETGAHFLMALSAEEIPDGKDKLDYLLRLQKLERVQPRELTREERWYADANELYRHGVELYRTARHAEAAKAFEKSLAVFQKLYPRTWYPNGHARIATVLTSLGLSYMALKDNAKAEPLYKKALEMHRQGLGEEHPDFAASLHILASLYHRQGAYAKAEPLYKQALEIRQKTLGEKHSDFATSLNNLARLYDDQGAYAKAEPLYKQALEIRRNVLGEKHPDFATSLDNLALLYDHQGAYAKAEPLYKQALEIRRKVLGEKHPLFATSLNNLGLLYDYQGAFAKAEPLLKQALAIRRKALGEKHPHYAASLLSLGFLYHRQGAYAKAEPLYKHALEINREILGEKHPHFATNLNNLALLYENQGTYAKAEPLYKQALEIRGQMLGEKHPDFAASLNSLASFYVHQGTYTKAEPLFKHALEIYREVFGEKHPDFATSLNNLANLYDQQGAYAKAEPLHKQALEILRHAHGEKHPDVATSLNNLAVLYDKQGDYAKAEPLYKQAMEIYREALGEKHPDVANSLNNLAHLYHKQGDYAKAEPLYKQAMEIYREALGEKHPDFANSLNNLAVLHIDRGDYAKAELLIEQALEIRRKALGEKHPDFATSLNNLAALYDRKGDYAKAEPIYKQTLEIYREALGEKHPDFARSLNNLAFCNLSRGEGKAAEKLGRQAVTIITEHLDATAIAQTEQAQIAFLRKQRFYLNNYLSFASAADTPAEDVYALVLPWKGAVTHRQRLTRFARAALSDDDKETAALFARLEEVSRQYANLIGRPVDPKNAKTVIQRLRKLQEEHQTLEVELARRTEAFRKLRQAKRMTPDELQKALPKDAVLLDFLVHQKSDAKTKLTTESLVAFVVSPEKIERIELGAIAPLTTAIDDFLGTLRRTQPVTGPKDPALVLRKKLWQPLARHVERAKIVLIAPDGPLCRLPFSALPSADGKKYLLEEHLISVLPVPQMLPEILAPRKNRPADWLPSLLGLGDVDFDAAPGAPPKTATWTPRRAGAAMRWLRLPATTGEILAIQNTFSKTIPDGRIRILRESEATEARFRKQAPQFEYLHLATHGFFAPKEVKSALKSDDKVSARLFRHESPRRFVGHHPGLLSGIVLAGANKPLADGDDGVLTALEVAELDLSKTELAVLSACETGLGEVAGGEGVLGLQRAFQIAGARSTVTSLWKVNDEATRILMERFYENYWKKNQGALEALRAAQLAMLRGELARGLVLDGRDTEDRRPPPLYWAAFVLSGDWR